MRDEFEQSQTTPSVTNRWLLFVREQIAKVPRIWQKFWPFGLTFTAAFLSFLIYSALFPPPTPLSTDQVEQSVVDIMASTTPPPAYSAQVYQAIIPSLVFIQTKSNAPDPDGNSGGLGSGVIVNSSGAILTALHVLAGADEINVIFSDGTRASASILVEEPENDIAVLAPSALPEVVVPAVLGNPNALRVGDEAFVVGHPLGLAGSMSSGVVSGFNRSLTPVGSEFELEGLIQFDAAVNPGNSGGPLLNRNGQVVGIVTALANPSEQNFFIGIGFAVPITAAGGAAGAPEQ